MLSFPRPRITIKRLVLTIIALFVGNCILFDMPLLSSKLPKYSGPYKVGTIDVEVPVEKRLIGEAVVKETKRPAFELETVLFSLYYPAVAQSPRGSAKKHHSWIPDIAQQGEGYARIARINNAFTNHFLSWALWSLVGGTTIPAVVDLPIHGSVKHYRDYAVEHPLDDDYGLPQFPVIVFSHGMASGRTSYTQWCGELASRGFVVAAIEHRDGSGPASQIISADGSSRNIYPLSETDLSPKPEMEAFKAVQLAMRQAEVEETVRVLHLLNDGFGADMSRLNRRSEGTDLAEWRGRLNMNRVVISGHSFGATLALQTLKDAPNKARPFVGAIVLDPGKHSGPLNDDITVPIVVVHSQSWSAKHTIFQGRPHFDVVKDLVVKVRTKTHGKAPKYAWFLTAKGTTHPSVTDAPLIEPLLLSWTTGSTIDAREGVLQYVKVSEEFLQFLADEHRRGILAEEVTHPTYDEDIRGEKRTKEMSRSISKYWQIHVSPSTSCPYPGLCGVETESRE